MAKKNARLAYIPQDANVISAGTRLREGRNYYFFSINICVCHFFVVPLQLQRSEQPLAGPDGVKKTRTY